MHLVLCFLHLVHLDTEPQTRHGTTDDGSGSVALFVYTDDISQMFNILKITSS